jgi:arylsulfatase A-like enzyme
LKAPAVSPVTVFGSALAWSQVAAAIHVTAVLYRVHVLGAFTQTSQSFAITSPVAYAMVFSLAAVPLALGAALRWRAINPRLVTALFAALAAFAALLLYRRIHPLSYVILAAGVGWQVGRWFARSPPAQRRLTRTVAPTIALTVLAVGAVPLLRSTWRERSILGSERLAAADAPNVLLLILDTVRASSLGAYGYARPTSPWLDSLARDGTLFEHAFSTASWSLPAHTSLMTGVWGHETGGDYLRRPHDSLPRIGEALMRHGYVTGAFMANAGWAGHESGMARGFVRFVSYRNNTSQWLWSSTLTQMPMVRGIIRGLATGNPSLIVRSIAQFDLQVEALVTPELRDASEIVDGVLSWTAGIGGRHPWFAALNVFDAHDPYATPFSARFDGGRTDQDRYDGAIAYIDSIVGRLMTALDERGDLDRTLVIVTSDHGEKFGEHGETGHGGGLYLPVVRVPLIVRYPGRFVAATRRPDPVTIADIPATILDVAGVTDSPLPGRSLALGPARPDDSSYVLFLSQRRVNATPPDRYSVGDSHGVLTAEWHLLRFPDGSEELYRWREDPEESSNLTAMPEGAAVVPWLRSVLTASRVDR